MHLDDSAVRQDIGRLLTWGVLLAATVTLVGGLLLLLQRGGEPIPGRAFVGVASELTRIASVVRGATTLDPAALTQLGLILLIATPVARVALAAVGFSMERDWLYVSVSLIVLVVLVASLLRAT